MIYAVRIVLYGLILLGLYGAASVSYKTITGASPCPDIFGLPACFTVLAGYLLILLASLLQPAKQYKWLFALGWLPVFSLAAMGTAFELINANTCPKSDSGLALCYVSLALSISVILLYTSYIKLGKK